MASKKTREPKIEASIQQHLDGAVEFEKETAAKVVRATRAGVVVFAGRADPRPGFRVDIKLDSPIQHPGRLEKKGKKSVESPGLLQTHAHYGNLAKTVVAEGYKIAAGAVIGESF